MARGAEAFHGENRLGSKSEGCGSEARAAQQQLHGALWWCEGRFGLGQGDGGCECGSVAAYEGRGYRRCGRHGLGARTLGRYRHHHGDERSLSKYELGAISVFGIETMHEALRSIAVIARDEVPARFTRSSNGAPSNPTKLPTTQKARHVSGTRAS